MLRNKKTGGIGKIVAYDAYKGIFAVDCDGKKKYYYTLAELNADWEDYTPAEPLIKDEKVRKAVRVWLEYCHVQLVNHYLCDGNSCFTFTDEGGNDCSLDFTFRIGNLESNTDYTIAELCGEEE